MKMFLLGALVALAGGGLAAAVFIFAARKLIGLSEKPVADVKRVPPWLTGIVERSFFYLLTVLNVQNLPTAMMAWLGLKLATNWNHPSQNAQEGRPRALLALLAGLVSLAFAYVGGAMSVGQWHASP